MGQLLVAVLASLWGVFGVSSVSKVISPKRRHAFAGALRALRLFPDSFVAPVAVGVSGLESAIAVGLAAALGGVVAEASWAVWTATVALLVVMTLLGVLTAGIVLALRRRTTAPCACFGPSERPLSWRHVLRNGLMLLVGVAGAAIAVFARPVVADLASAGLAGAVGVIIAAVLIRLDEIVELFTPTGLAGRARARS
ncbi:MAG: hypothetical protein J2P19_24865 [Pseudonocardia sp.]|nr:hypothetical protein [Pseudonocardia sp.]